MEVKHTKLLVFGMLMAMLAMCCHGQIDATEPKIVIVGAGMAGVTAATRLQELGYKDIVIWEGSDRIGGRMRDIKLGGLTVEQGANWIQSLGTNPIFQKAKEYGLNRVRTYWDDLAAYDYDGTNITGKMRELYSNYSKIFTKTENFANQSRFNGELDATYRSGLIRNNWNPKTRFEDLIETYFYDFEFGFPPDASSLQESVYDTYYIHESHLDANVIDSRGYAHIARRMLEDSIKQGGVQISFNKQVDKIKQDESQVIIHTTDNSTIRGDIAIVTVSMGVLQNRLIQFVPSLPDWKLDAIDQIQMTLFYNIFMKFPYQFWDDNQFILHASQKRSYFPIIQNVNKINPGTNILHFPIFWQEVRRIDRLPKEQVKNEIMQILNKLYFPGSNGMGVPEPLDYAIPTFNSDPLFMGCFSNIPPGYTKERHLNLSRPIDKIFFAGEAMPLNHFGFVQGAWYSGMETADKVHAFIPKK